MTHLVVQAKSSDRPWVVFSNPHDPTRDEDEAGIEAGTLLAVSNLLRFKHVRPTPLPLFDRQQIGDRVGTAFHESFKQPNQPSQIFEAVVSACKAAAARLDNLGYKLTELNEYQPTGVHLLDLFLPIVVFDGTLCEAYSDETGGFQLEEIAAIPIRFSYASPKYAKNRDVFGPNEPLYYPNIVTLSGFADFLKQVEDWSKSIFDQVGRSLDEDEWFETAPDSDNEVSSS